MYNNVAVKGIISKIKNNNFAGAPIIVVSFLVFAGLVTAFNMNNMEEKKLASVTSLEFVENLKEKEDITVLDVRTPREFEERRLRGAVNMNYNSPEFRESLSELDTDGSYAVYCRSGRRSADALKVMEELGFKWVIDLSGGIEALSSDTEAMGILVD